MDRMTARTFNGPLEAGVRSVALLVAAYPAAYDIRQLTIFDYLLVRTSELDGPEKSPSALAHSVSRRDRTAENRSGRNRPDDFPKPDLP